MVYIPCPYRQRLEAGNHSSLSHADSPEGRAGAADMADTASTISFASSAPAHVVGMIAENRDLIDKMSSMHARLKLTRAKLAQRERELESKEAEVGCDSQVPHGS